MLRKNLGFTLIELLVVIAIIAILAAILFPVFTQAQRTAKKQACLSNLMQLGRGIIMYTDVHSRLPDMNWDPDRRKKPVFRGMYGAMWFDYVMPYVKSMNVFVCPARPKDGIGSYGSRYPFGYAMVLSCENGSFENAHTMSSIRNPSRKIMVSESGGLTSSEYHAVYYSIDVSDIPRLSDIRDYLQVVHGGTSNYIFCDGHARPMSLNDTIAPRLLWNKTDKYPMWIDGAWRKSESDAQSSIMNKLNQ